MLLFLFFLAPVTYLNQMGICYKNLGMFEDATKTYNMVIKLDHDKIPALYNKAMLCEAKNELPEAVKLLERALKKDPSFTSAQIKLTELRAKLIQAS